MRSAISRRQSAAKARIIDIDIKSDLVKRYVRLCYDKGKQYYIRFVTSIACLGSLTICRNPLLELHAELIEFSRTIGRIVRQL